MDIVSKVFHYTLSFLSLDEIGVRDSDLINVLPIIINAHKADKAKATANGK
ncbi:hypothetical protein ALTER154_80532 [Alteromonas sp. 154]|nr:hypothetical protein ALTER154_80532 [Alteromonas sp. 154]